MVFCNLIKQLIDKMGWESHNPYFNRWFSAITQETYADECYDSHNPYFNRWFSAITRLPVGDYLFNESQSLF